MKKISVVTASCLCGAISATTLPLSAMEVTTAVSGTSHTLGVGIDSSGMPVQLGTILNSVNIRLKENGKKSANPHDRSTAVSNSLFNPIPVNVCVNALGQGVLLEYVYSTGVSTRPNGDLVYAEMVTADPAKQSTVCYTPAPPYYFEVKLYRDITGGTGEFEGACGWTEFNGSGKFFTNPDVSSFSVFEGTQVGELFHSSDCP